MRPVLSLILAACMVAAAIDRTDGAPLREDDPAKKDLALLQGAWEIVGKEFMGKKATKEEIDKLKGEMVIKDGKVTQWQDDAGLRSVVSEATLKIDPKAEPKALDLTYTKGELVEGKTIPAIYEVKDDTLKVCYALTPDDKRPTDFAGKGDGKAFFLTYKRVKK
jgi:uncharacterized protein (TIGR03067 family)